MPGYRNSRTGLAGAGRHSSNHRPPGGERRSSPLTTEWGGQVISFPRGQVHTAHQRWVQIAAQFDGGNYAALAATHGYTERHIRKIVTRMKNEKKGEET